MAIAAFADVEELETPWPRPVTVPGDARIDERGLGSLGRFEVMPGSEPLPALRPMPELRSTQRARSLRVRRRRILLASLVVGLLVLLALPLRATAGDPVASAPALRAGTEYVVQPGDTLWSIAQRLDPSGDPRVLVAQLLAEAGSYTIVPGEHLRLP